MYKDIAKICGVKKTQKLIELVVNLDWEYDRMSQDGQDTFDELCQLLEIEQEDTRNEA
jgi:hypothetical protein